MASTSSAPSATTTTSPKKDTPTNPRGIPYAPFVDSVSDYISSTPDVETTLKSFSEMIQKYQFMEVSTTRRAASLRSKIPDIQKTLDTVCFLATRDEGAADLETWFELNDTVAAKAKVQRTEECYVWLGANVMLAYPLPEARELLEEKLRAARLGLGNCEEDLDFLREQITTLEVATARVYNWDVGQRRKEKEEGKAKQEEEEVDETND